jgi:hypothetical protein
MSRSTENAAAMKIPSQASVVAGDPWQVPLLVALHHLLLDDRGAP